MREILLLTTVSTVFLFLPDLPLVSCMPWKHILLLRKQKYFSEHSATLPQNCGSLVLIRIASPGAIYAMFNCTYRYFSEDVAE